MYTCFANNLIYRIYIKLTKLSLKQAFNCWKFCKKIEILKCHSEIFLVSRMYVKWRSNGSKIYLHFYNNNIHNMYYIYIFERYLNFVYQYAHASYCKEKERKVLMVSSALEK